VRRLRAAAGSTIAAAASLIARSGVLRGSLPALRRGGLAVATGLAALRSPARPVLVREHDTITGRELDDAVAATASRLAAAWPAGARIGVRGDGGIDFIVVLAAAGLAGLDAMPIGPRLGEDEVRQLAGRLDAIVDSWDAAVRDGAGVPPARPAGRLLMLSTGTTGIPAVTPRGRLGARGVLQLADADRRLRIPSGPVLVLAPPDHGHGLTMVTAGLVRGRTVLLAGGIRPAEQARLAALHRPETISGVPAQLARLLDATEPEGVRLIVSGSSRLSAGLRTRLAATGARVLDCYGTTETGTVAIEGRPLAGVTIALDAAGRIQITSPLGGRPVAPGDRGHLEHGRLVVEGRTGELVDSGGELLSPAHIGRILESLPGVAAARVWTEPDDLLGSRLCAEVTVTDAALDAAALTRRLTSRAGRSAVPRSLVITMS
jgi:acyl-CoA synthetase (AMP-forming)/AMP-acid ligase II